MKNQLKYNCFKFLNGQEVRLKDDQIILPNKHSISEYM